MDVLHEKKQRLEDYLQSLGSVAVAFSSGVDSTFLLKVAHEVLGDRAIAVTIRAPMVPDRELSEAEDFCRTLGVEQVVADVPVLELDAFVKNPPDRCYHCKKALFTKILAIAQEQDVAYVAEGSNVDDNGDYRPGMRAVAELEVKSPLREAGLTKADIRALSKELDLPTWDKPSFACLASRFVYGETITAEKLSMVDKAEQRLLDLGFRQVRVRIHGDLARIEVDPTELAKILPVTRELNAYLRELGFLYVTLDLGGYQMGSMNKTLEP